MWVATVAALGVAGVAQAGPTRVDEATAERGNAAKIRAAEQEEAAHEAAFARTGGTVVTQPPAPLRPSCPVSAGPDDAVLPASPGLLPEPAMGSGSTFPTELLRFARGRSPLGRPFNVTTGWRGSPRRATALLEVRPISLCGGVVGDYAFTPNTLDVMTDQPLEIVSVASGVLTMSTLGPAGIPCAIAIDIDAATVTDPCSLVDPADVLGASLPVVRSDG